MGLGKLGEWCDIGGGIGYVKGKEVMFVEVVGLGDKERVGDELG